MAGKTRSKPALFTIEKIKAGLIVNSLEKHIFSAEGNMTTSQVTAALGLLRKVHPDLAAQQVTGQVATKMTISWKSNSPSK